MYVDVVDILLICLILYSWPVPLPPLNLAFTAGGL